MGRPSGIVREICEFGCGPGVFRLACEPPAPAGEGNGGHGRSRYAGALCKHDFVPALKSFAAIPLPRKLARLLLQVLPLSTLTGKGLSQASAEFSVALRRLRRYYFCKIGLAGNCGVLRGSEAW
jgi:hypothetical protein